MQLEFPYQIVMFLDREPKQGEPVYYGEHGWYPQVALKRRFKLDGISEEKLIEELKDFFAGVNIPAISTGELVKSDRIPVQVVHITNQDEIKTLHSQLLTMFGNSIISRYPDREGENYYPHITAEYDGKFVMPVDEYTSRIFADGNIWLLKDIGDENSLAYAKVASK